MPYLPYIDGLRAIAVLSVVLFHALPGALPGGFIGVDIFFVISGYLITTIILGDMRAGSFSFADFYFRRARRLFPALFIVLVTTWCIGWWTLTPGEFRSLGKHIASGVGFLANFAFWKETGYFDTDAELKPLLHLWSLGVEEQFYLLWPLILYLFRRRPLVAITAIALSSFALNIIVSYNDRQSAFFLPHIRAWELLLGAALTQIKIRQGATIASSLGIALIVAALLSLNSESIFPGWNALLPVLGATLIIYGGPQTALANILSRKPIVFIGLISYPLYLWHWPLLSYAQIALDTPPATTKLLIVILSLTLAAATYRFVEHPVRAKVRSRSTAPWFAATAVIVLALGLVTTRDGFANRYPQLVAQLFNYSYAYQKGYRFGTCFLDANQGPDEFSEECIDRDFSGNPSIFLWGDSYAAHLLPGLRNLEIPVAQFSASGCPPIMDFAPDDRPKCVEINSQVLNKVASIRPQTVVLSAHWLRYQRELDLDALAPTIASLRNAGVSRVVLVGPVPQWKPSLPKVLAAHHQNDKQHKVPERVMSGLTEEVSTMDYELRQRAAQLGINYASAVSTLCNVDGCLTRLGDELTAWDDGHFTEVGATVFVKLALSSYLSNDQKPANSP